MIFKAGPTICELLRTMYSCFELRLESVDLVLVKKKLREIHLRVFLELIKSGGAISLQHGPMDAQNQLVNELCSLQYEKSDLDIAMHIIENIGNYINFVILIIILIFILRIINLKLFFFIYFSSFNSW